MSATYFICPSCGANVRVGSKGCRKCTRTPGRRAAPPARPWEQEGGHDGLDLDGVEDDSFDYDQFVAEEFGGRKQRSGREWMWWGTGVLLLLTLLYLTLN